MKKIALLFLILTLQIAQAANVFTQNGSYGLKDDEGNVILKAQYKSIKQLEYVPVKTVLIPMQSTKNPAPVKLDSYKVQQNNLWGVFSSKGKKIADCKYDEIKVNDYGSIILVKDGNETVLHPAKNTAKKTTKTLEAVVGLPVTIVAGAMMPIEVISKLGKK